MIQGTSGKATTLHRQVEVDLGAHHSPDLFPGQHEVSEATSLHLARQVRQAAAQTRWAVERAARQAYEDPSPRPCGRPPAFAARIRAAVSDVVQAKIAHAEAQARQCEAEPRHQPRTLNRQLLKSLRHGTHPLQALPPTGRAHLEQVAGDCADRFQRSNSGEGRNGQLALHHHGRHRLSNRKLAALTAVHNDPIRRADGTTAAERFFASLAVPTTSTAQTALSDPGGGVSGLG